MITERIPWWKALALVFDKKVGYPAKIVAILAIIYAVVPTDLLPDIFPILGWVDDVLVVIGSVLYVVRTVRDALARSSSAQR